MPAVSREAFERRYRLSADPWNFATSEYERTRYQTILAALIRRRYASAFEPGCSIGVLTAELAGLCDRVTATDIAPSAVARARQHCAHLRHVDIRCADLATHPESGPFDLIVVSEIGYYFSQYDLIRIGAALAQSLSRGGELIAAHWLGNSPDHVLHGDQVHHLLRANLPLEWVKGDRADGVRVDSWLRP
jgi:protein-L-isoaspartate O-methyltransferase